MPNYGNGKIYKMECNETGCIYIGSTTQPITKRIAGHKTNYKSFLNNNNQYCTSSKVLEKNNFQYEVLENYKCCTKKELESREREYIDENKVIYGDLLVNKVVPTRSSKEYRLENREHLRLSSKDYYQNNREQQCKKQKERDDNRTEEQRLDRKKKQKERYDNRTEEQRLHDNKKAREQYHKRKAQATSTVS